MGLWATFRGGVFSRSTSNHMEKSQSLLPKRCISLTEHSQRGSPCWPLLCCVTTSDFTLILSAGGNNMESSPHLYKSQQHILSHIKHFTAFHWKTLFTATLEQRHFPHCSLKRLVNSFVWMCVCVSATHIVACIFPLHFIMMRSLHFTWHGLALMREWVGRPRPERLALLHTRPPHRQPITAS